MKNYIILIFGLFLLSAYPKYSTSLEEARSRAKSQNVPYFVNVYADWCVVCKHMEETALSDSRVQSQMDNYYEYTAVDLDSPEGQLFAVQQNIQSLPALFIFDAQDKLLYKSQKSHSVQDLMNVLSKHKKGKKTMPSSVVVNSPAKSKKVITSAPKRKVKAKPTSKKPVRKKKKKSRMKKKKKERYSNAW